MNHCRTTCLTFLLSLLMTSLHAQELVLHGRITSEKANPVPSATCLLLDAGDSTLVKNTITGSDGRFSLSVLPNVPWLLQVKSTGYVTTAKAIAPATGDLEINLVLKEEKSLSGVTITSMKALIEQKPDRTIFNIEKSVSATGGDALDALRKTPGVLVINNQVTMAGKDAVSVMINGRLQQLSGEDLTRLLRSIPSDNLSKIEVITSPSARYDAEGNSGIVNLITRKNLKPGLKGSITTSYNRNTYNSASLGTSLFYQQGKLNCFANASADKEAYEYTNKGNTYYPGEFWYQEVHQGDFIKSGRIQLGADYAIGRRSVLGGSYTYNPSSTRIDEHTAANIFNDNQRLDSVANTAAFGHEQYNNKHTVNLNYEWKIDTTGKKLNIDADYYAQQSERVKEFDVNHSLPDGSATGFISNNRVTVSPTLVIRSVKADITFPLKMADLTFGAKASWVTSKIANLYETEVASDYIVDPSQTNTFNYTEQTQAVYLSAQKTINSAWQVQAGLRCEHTHTTGYSPTAGVSSNNDYTKLFPSGFVQYKPSDDHVFSLSYSRRINRPGYNLLNPFRFYYSLNSYTVGNPALQPAFNNILRLNYTFKGMYSFAVFGNYTSNYWDRISNVDSVATNVGFTKANIGTARYCGASFSINCNPARWWEFHGSLNGQYADFNLNHYDNSSYSGINGWIEAGNSFYLNKSKTFSAEINGYYYTPRQKDYKRWDEMSAIYIGVKALLLHQKLVVAINADDLFARAFWFQTNLANGTTEYSYDDEHSVRIAITYKFGNKNVKQSRERNAAIEELQRAN